MSWQLASFVLLGLALAGGFAWYERARPDARIIALVATLAAFAALGRIAFAALPNVKPTTDIVLISGYALGGAPGFVVGALAGLTSNFFFGQGPWTPWQMAAWGATGLIGAGLATLTRRRISRWPLALLCTVVGFLFAATQDVGDWVNYSDHSASQLGIYVGKGVGFDVVHAVGCLLFALAFGPALAHSLKRFAARLETHWLPSSSSVAPILLIALTASAALTLSTPGQAQAASTASYLRAAQNGDGGFGAAPGQASSTLYSGWAALGLAADGINPQDVSHGGSSLLDYIRATAGAASDPGSIERTLLVAGAAGASPGSFGGHDLLAALQHDIGADGAVSRQVNLTTFAVLALHAVGAAVPPQTTAWLVRQQNSDGGFSFGTRGGSSDVDDTGAALEALVSAGGPDRTRQRAVAFITRQQNRDGGFPSQPGGPSNAQSTAWAIQGLTAAGADPGALHHGGAPSPLSYLTGLIAADGHVQYSRGSDQTPVWVTAEAAMALAGKPLPLAAVPASATPSRSSATHHAKRHAKPARHARHRRPPGVPTGADVRQTAALAGAVGVATALALAPVGLG